MLKQTDYPRLLIISPSAFNYLSGGGITFTNLFHGWPKDKIACLHSDKIEPSTDVCEKYYRLGEKEFPWAFPFSIANRFVRQDKLEKGLRNPSAAFSAARKTGMNVLGEEIPSYVRISTELRKFILDFKPDVIYTILGNLKYMELVERVSADFNLPIVVHMMDDWPNMLYRRGILGPFMRRKMNKKLDLLFTEASACLAICDSMADEFEKRYGRPFPAFHNCLDAEYWLKNAKKDRTAGVPFKILYGGALMDNSQLRSVNDTADVVKELHKSGMNVIFEIYAPKYSAVQYRKTLERDGCVKVFDMPETMEIESLFVAADLLLLPVNFDKESVRYIKYSMPTKVPAYMFSGTPTLAYGPESVASIRYAKQWAFCVTKKDKKELCGAIRKLAVDEKLREHLANKAQKIAKERHDRKKISADFHNILVEAAKHRI